MNLLKLIATLMLALPLMAKADILVLVHGYLGSANSWDSSGITLGLQQAGWQNKGQLYDSAQGPQLKQEFTGKTANSLYRVNMFADAPLELQARQLAAMLQRVRKHHAADEKLILIAHSAGAVVSRLALVRGIAVKVDGLISIAGPHLGTFRAEQALNAVDIPFPASIIADWFAGNDYHIVKRSQGLLYDLVRPYPGSLLFWLNQQTHPDIFYASVIRIHPYILSGDQLVPAYSQDMNNIPSLKGKVSTVSVNSTHYLHPNDVKTILKLLESV